MYLETNGIKKVYLSMTSTPRPITDQERHYRRLSDKIKLAFDQACNDGELIAAAELLATLEFVMLKTPPSDEQREGALATLYACQERLFELKREALKRSNGGGQDHEAPPEGSTE